jgi:hypothetical protein
MIINSLNKFLPFQSQTSLPLSAVKVWIQGFVLDRQVVSTWARCLALFCFSYFFK